MKVESTGVVLSTVFVDYDNIYLSLKRKNEEAAKRFAKDAALWLREIESGRLITSATGQSFAVPRRIVMTRCYGNPVPRRNASDNSTDMNSFPFVRHHFLRAGFEVVDCPPLTAQLKNSADIRMVMDVRDVLNHETRFDEFILLSGDADFTPVLHRLRAHARRTVVFANDHTAQPYTAISDGEVREADLISLLLEGRIGVEGEARAIERAPTSAELEGMRKAIVNEVVGTVRSAAQPVPLESLADKAVRVLGHEKTVGSQWGGIGGFRDLLAKALPRDIKISESPPYVAYEPGRQIAEQRQDQLQARLSRPEADPRLEPKFDYAPTRRMEPYPEQAATTRPETSPEPRYEAARYEAPRYPVAERDAAGREAAPYDARGDFTPSRGDFAPARGDFAPSRGEPSIADRAPQAPQRGEPQVPAYGASGYFAPAPERASANVPVARAPYPDMTPTAPAATGYGARAPAPPQRSQDNASQIQQSIARIHEACQAPPLSPPEYRVLFEVMAEEIATNNLSGQQTLTNIVQRARDMGLEVRRDDVRFVLEVVSEADPWFEQGASVPLFASRFRNFVVARCRTQGLNLSADEIDLIDAWFGGAPASQRPAPGAAAPSPSQGRASAPAGYGLPQAPPQPQPQQAQDRWPVQDTRGLPGAPQPAGFGGDGDEEFPRIVRSRLRG